jgi:rRNA maturation endonuclease Nob1
MGEGKQAEHLTELARMKLATGLTDEQILALAARDSAAIAEAFKERYKSKSAEEVMRIYQDRLGDRDRMLKTIQEMADKGGDRIERLAAKALEQMGTTAATRAQTEGTTVVTGGQAGQPVIIGKTPPASAQQVEKVVICTACNVELPVGTKFCNNCGHSIAHRG